MKIRYSQWIKDRPIAINSLRFDPDNPRIREVKGGERKIIEELAYSEDLAELLIKITDFGIAPIERLVVSYEDGKPIVIEGNRRLAVFKMLIAPEKAPSSVASLVRKAINELGESEIPKKLRCDIPPDGAEARVYAYMKHASEKFSRNWAPIQKAVVAAAAADKAERGEGDVELSAADVREARAMVELYRLAGILSRRKGGVIKADSLRDFQYEATKRVFLAKEVGAMLGLRATERGIALSGDPEAFSRFFEATIVKMGNRGTRVFNTVEDAKDWVEKSGYLPTSSEKSKLADFIQKTDAKGDQPSEEEEIDDPKKPKKSSSQVNRRKSKVFPLRLDLQIALPKLESMLGEIEKLDVMRQANISGVMLRCVLELAADGALQKRGLMKEYRAWLREREDTLKNRIQWIKDEKRIPLDRDTKRVLGGLVDSSQARVSLESLNGWVHSNWCPTHGEIVQVKAAELTPLLQLLVSKP